MKVTTVTALRRKRLLAAVRAMNGILSRLPLLPDEDYDDRRNRAVAIVATRYRFPWQDVASAQDTCAQYQHYRWWNALLPYIKLLDLPTYAKYLDREL